MENIVNFYRYNSDVRKKYLDAIGKMPWEEVVKDQGASFASIRNVFLHVLDAYRRWFGSVISGIPSDEDLTESPEKFKNVDEIRRAEREIDSLVMGVIEGLHEKDLSRVFNVEGFDKVKRDITMEAILIHMIEEELQHRGELNCMFWQQNVNPPITGYHRWVETREHKQR